MNAFGLTLQSLSAITALLPTRNPFSVVQTIGEDAVIFKLGDLTYAANSKYPKTTLNKIGRALTTTGWTLPITIAHSNVTGIDGDLLKQTVERYVEGDDVFSTDFLGGLYFTLSSDATLDSSALQYLADWTTNHIWVDDGCSSDSSQNLISIEPADVPLPPGPYLASISPGAVSFAAVYRLYTDSYRDFLYGTYESNEGSRTFTSLDVMQPPFGYPYIPVPSRIYSWTDARPFAGFRVAVEDLFDLKDLKTTAGSRAWAYIQDPANQTAPSIQCIVDLGGVVVGKYKTAQFASGAHAWNWQDDHYPFNPRGDGWLTCSASSSGGGCAIAAYDWLDFAIGSDTGSSMRRPAAVSGTYGQRPSQGMMSVEHVVPLGAATDTAGVFSRDPHKWVYFSKHWYTPSLFQSTNITGLSALSVPDDDSFPATILYPIDFLPLNNSAAQSILDEFIGNLSTIFNMTTKKFNFTATVKCAPNPDVANLANPDFGALDVLNSRTQWEEVARPLITRWAALFDGRFPPLDPARRKILAVERYEANFQYSTPGSCSESVMIGDIASGGLPLYREQNLNDDPSTSFLAAIRWATICPVFGCADFTIPIGEVPYFSQVTNHEEMVPVTVNIVVKRGCDFVLYNMIEKLADQGVLREVKTGRTAS